MSAPDDTMYAIFDEGDLRACLVRVRVKLFGVVEYAEDLPEGSLFGRNASKTEEAAAQKRLT